jgi:hypothetical protein
MPVAGLRHLKHHRRPPGFAAAIARVAALPVGIEIAAIHEADVGGVVEPDFNHLAAVQMREASRIAASDANRATRKWAHRNLGTVFHDAAPKVCAASVVVPRQAGYYQ